MKTLLLWWVMAHPVNYFYDPDRPLWADSQHVFVTNQGMYYEYLIWPTEHELTVGYQRIPLLRLRTFQWHQKP
jgi:hypothetical protein